MINSTSRFTSIWLFFFKVSHECTVSSTNCSHFIEKTYLTTFAHSIKHQWTIVSFFSLVVSVSFHGNVCSTAYEYLTTVEFFLALFLLLPALAFIYFSNLSDQKRQARDQRNEHWMRKKKKKKKEKTKWEKDKMFSEWTRVNIALNLWFIISWNEWNHLLRLYKWNRFTDTFVLNV